MLCCVAIVKLPILSHSEFALNVVPSFNNKYSEKSQINATDRFQIIIAFSFNIWRLHFDVF